nr:zinc-binding dehydrogenase [Paracoccus sp. S-4012]
MPVAVLAEVPETVGDLAAAALPLAGLSAAAVLASGAIALGQSAEGRRVLVHAAAGGVGRIAVQLARLAGAEVHATASAANREVLQDLGAARVWARDAEDFAALREVDLVIDLLGGEVHARSYQTLRPGGILACLRAAPFTDRSAEFGVRVSVAEVAPDPAVLAQLLDLVAAGKLDPGPAHVLPARDFAEAQRRSDTGRLSGKLVLDFQA